MALLDHCVREELNASAPRAMAVLNPLKVVIEIYPEDQVDELQAVNNPEDPAAGSRPVPFCRELWIERDDFMENPPAKFFRLAPGREVRLRYGYLVTCREAVRGPDGEICELRCVHDPATRGGNAPDGRKVKATIHWVSARHAVDAEVRLYDRLLSVADPGGESPDADFRDFLNPGSLSVLTGAKAEPMLADAKPGERWQFERLGYFCADPDTRPGKPVFNRIVPLKDTWAKVAART
jgi:glutaminyl-tRNA synthetase